MRVDAVDRIWVGLFYTERLTLQFPVTSTSVHSDIFAVAAL